MNRGAPANRRRWLDLTLAAMDAGYLRALQTYTRALAGRNALLRSGRGTPAELAAYVKSQADTLGRVIRTAGIKPQ
mgnify:CR=1 FL=1